MNDEKRKAPNRLGMYSDVQQVLDQALAAGGGEYVLPSHGAAVNWRQRAYKFRKLFAEVHGAKHASKYDALVMPDITKSDTCTVTIRIRTAVGEFRPNNALPTEEEDELLASVRDLALKIEQGEK